MPFRLQVNLESIEETTDADFREAMANGEISAEELNEYFMQLGISLM